MEIKPCPVCGRKPDTQSFNTEIYCAKNGRTAHELYVIRRTEKRAVFAWNALVDKIKGTA